MENWLIVSFGIITLLYLLHKLFNRPNKEFEKEIDKILTSDKYKVKGQYD